MTIKLQAADNTILAGGEANRVSPLHIQNMPLKGNHYRASAFTGTIAAATAADAEVFQFRFVGGTKSYALVTQIKLSGAGIVAVATALGPVGFYVTPARAWTVAGSGGTRLALTTNNSNLETAIDPSQVNDIGISTTAALTAGTKTLDTSSIGQVIGGVMTGAVTTSQVSPLFPRVDLFSAADQGGMPLVLATQEGFVIRTTHVGPTALTYTVGFTVTWVEVTAF